MAHNSPVGYAREALDLCEEADRLIDQMRVDAGAEQDVAALEALDRDQARFAVAREFLTKVLQSP